MVDNSGGRSLPNIGTFPVLSQEIHSPLTWIYLKFIWIQVALDDPIPFQLSCANNWCHKRSLNNLVVADLMAGATTLREEAWSRLAKLSVIAMTQARGDRWLRWHHFQMYGEFLRAVWGRSIFVWIRSSHIFNTVLSNILEFPWA